MKNVIWMKSAEIICEAGVVKKNMVISVNDDVASRLATSGFEITKVKATHERDKDKKEWVPIDGKKKSK